MIVRFFPSEGRFGAIASRDEKDRDDVLRSAAASGLEPFIHGRTVFVQALPSKDEDDSLAGQAKLLLDLGAGPPSR